MSAGWAASIPTARTAELPGIRHMKGVRVFLDYPDLTTSIYSKRMLDSFGMDGAVRVSPLHCNAVEDIDSFLRITQELAAL